MKKYYCPECKANLKKSEIISQPIDSPKKFNGYKVTMPWGVSAPDTAKYYCRKHNTPIEIRIIKK